MARPVGQFSIAILAGGGSTRMGENKAMLELGGKPLVGHVIDALRPLAGDLFLVANDAAPYERFGLPVHPDLCEGGASLVGVYSALSAARTDRCLVVSCDMPFIEPELARLMLRKADGFDAVVPVGSAGREPLFALYTRGCLGAMRERIESGDMRILDVLAGLDVRWLDTEEIAKVCDPALAFANINSNSDLERARSVLEERRTRPGRAGTGARTASLPLVCFVGNKDSGKTTVLEKLTAFLCSKGLRVAFIKHDVHGFTMDHEGTDTFRLGRAGAGSVIISSPGQVACIIRVDGEMSLGELRRLAGESADIILVEGFKSADADRIEVHGDADPDSLVCAPEDLLAVVSDRDIPGVSLPVFSHSDIEDLARFLAGRYRIEAEGEGGTA